MGYLIDTNILLRSCQKDHAMHASAVDAVETLLARGEKLYIAPQNIIEFWNVATRLIDKNGLGMSIQKTAYEAARFEKLLSVKLDLPIVHQQWLDLVTRYEVKGAKVHDARLVAVAIVHGLTHVLTFNDKDFRRFQEITVVHPDEV